MLDASALAHSDDLHFAHPLIAESPSPDTKVRLGEEDGVSVVNLSPGVKLSVSRALELGAGVSVPISRHEEFGVQGVVSAFWHF